MEPVKINMDYHYKIVELTQKLREMTNSRDLEREANKEISRQLVKAQMEIVSLKKLTTK